MAKQDTFLGSFDHRTIGWIVSVVLHVLVVLFILYLPKFTRDAPVKAFEGVLVSFGLPVESSGEEVGQIQEQMQEENMDDAEKEPVEAKDEKLVRNTLSEEQSEIKLETTPSRIEKSKAKITIPEEQLETPEEKLDKAKSEFGKLFSSKGSSSRAKGDQGDPLGEPDTEILVGISRGRGKIGGGLDERGILYEPEIIEHSQRSGKVVIKVCVDKRGKVVSARYTQRGSTTTDLDLVDIAEISARKYRFTPSEFEEQCGTISISFIVR